MLPLWEQENHQKGGVNVLIENVIRLGRPLIGGGMAPRDVLLQVSDVMGEGKKFFQNVLVVEIEDTRFAVHPVSRWGEFREKEVGKNKTREEFFPDDKVVGANFVFPRAGNPLKAQGWYGIPAYPIYTKTLLQFAAQGDEDAGTLRQEAIYSIKAFIEERKRKTPFLTIADDLIDTLAEEIYTQASQLKFDNKDKSYGLMLLVQLKEGSPFVIKEKPVPLGDLHFSNIGTSLLYPGKFLVSNLGNVLEAFWPAKIAEGAEMGEEKNGQCFLCKEKGALVSAYCKSWPWFLHTWNCPNPLNWKKNEMTKGIAICHSCYTALSYGATVLTKLTTELDYNLTKELFTPVSSARGKEDARKGQAKARIYGSAYVVPLLDNKLEGEEKEEFVEGFRIMLEKRGRDNRLDTHLRTIAGFDYVLPQELSRDDYRLNLIYFSGDPNRGDIHVRAIIEDVVPSIAIKLDDIIKKVQRYAVEVAQNMLVLTEQNRNRILSIYSSLPFLLVNAFGSSYLWTTLDSIMHNAPIAANRFIKNSSLRMVQLAHNLPDSIFSLRDEVIFYLAFKQFLRLYAERERCEKEGIDTVRDWQELKQVLMELPPHEMVFSNVEEVGFAAGVLTRLFARQYYPVSGKKDFVKHRVMTFGSDLTPKTIWKRALVKMREYAARLDMRVTNDFWQRLAIVLLEFENKGTEIEREKDSFMAMFWSGYNLALSPQERESEEEEEKN